MNTTKTPKQQKPVAALRILAADMVEKAKSGHPGMPLGMADVAYILFKDFLNYNPADPVWACRDRFVLSAGHGSALLYALLYLTGYEQMTIHQLQNFRQAHSLTAGHPEYYPSAGIETTTGPLGQGIANAVGMALAAKIHHERNPQIPLVKVYVICGDGCLMEGVAQEAISLAGHLRLNNLILLFDDNSISIDGSTSLATSEDHTMRMEAAGWRTYSILGHDYQEISAGLNWAISADNKPSFLACKTKIGYGAPHKQGSAAVHGSPLGEAEINALRQELSWMYPPFIIPAEILAHYRSFPSRCYGLYNKTKHINFALPDIQEAVAALDKAKLNLTKQKIATRKASENALNIVAPILDRYLLGGSADLTSSNLTKAMCQKAITPSDYSGNYIHYGVREHVMAAVMNGLSIFGGFIPYGGTFLCFADYARPAIRLSSLINCRVIYVLTHDSIGLGEDGPTHQAVEHLASLRAIPNLTVIRPADEAEAFEAWQIALQINSPTVLALSRQSTLPVLRPKDRDKYNLSAFGAYVVLDHNTPEVTIFASGSEVGLAQQVIEKINEVIKVRLVSVPCLELFKKQPQAYIDNLLNNNSLKIVIEAGIRQGWDWILGRNGLFFGVEGFGISAPYTEVYAHFGLTAELIAEGIIRNLTRGAEISGACPRDG
jgi:transketolase